MLNFMHNRFLLRTTYLLLSFIISSLLSMFISQEITRLVRLWKLQGLHLPDPWTSSTGVEDPTPASMFAGPISLTCSHFPQNRLKRKNPAGKKPQVTNYQHGFDPVNPKSEERTEFRLSKLASSTAISKIRKMG